MWNKREIKKWDWKSGWASAVLFSLISAPVALASASEEFKFPVALCVFTQWKLKNEGGKFEVKPDDFTSEYAYRVENVQAMNSRGEDGKMLRTITGDFSGTYAVPSSPYRVRFEGKIQQAADAAGGNTMRLRSYLEKRDSRTGEYAVKGQMTTNVPGKAGQDGSIWENVPAYTFNSVEMKSFMTRGKPDQTKVLAGLRDGKLDVGAVFSAGPVCGLIDAITAKKITSNREKFHDIFDRIPDAQPVPKQAPVIAQEKTTRPSAKEELWAEQEKRDALERSNANAETLAQSAQPASPATATEAPVTPPAPSQDPQQDAIMAEQEQQADAQAQAYAQASAEAQYDPYGFSGEQRDPANAAEIAPLAPPQTAQQAQEQVSALEQQKQILMQQQLQLEEQQSALIQRQQELADVEASGTEAGEQQAQNAIGAQVVRSF